MMALLSPSNALVSVNRSHVGLHDKVLSLQISSARSNATALPSERSEAPEQKDLTGPPPLLKLHQHLFLILVCYLVILGVQRYRLLVLNQIPQDADPSDPLAYVFKARQLHEGNRGRL